MTQEVIFVGKVYRIGDTVLWTTNDKPSKTKHGKIKKFLKTTIVLVSLEGKRDRVLPISMLTLVDGNRQTKNSYDNNRR